MGIIRAAIYLRISRDDAQNGLAIDRQREDCEALAAARGWEVVRTYVDQGISASRRTVKRPSYDAMADDFKAGKFDALICYDLDRLTRQPVQLEAWIEAAEERGLSIVTATGEADLSTDNGRMFARVKASVARAEIERKGARQRRANAQRIESGRPAPGRRVYGFEPGGLVPREPEAIWVRYMFERVEALDSLHSIARALNEKGVPTATTGKTWSSSQVKALLKRPRNAGLLISHGQIQPRSEITALVPREQYENVLRILDARRGEGIGRPTAARWASGLVMCATCGKPLRPKRLSSPRSTSRVPFYMCESRVQRTERDDRRHVSIAAEILESEIRAEVVSAFLLSPRALLPDDGGPDVHALTAERESLSKRRSDLATLIAQDLLTLAEASPQLTRLKTQITAIDAELQRAAQSSAVSAMLLESRDFMTNDNGKRIASFTKAGRAAQILADRFDALPVERRHDLAAQLLHVDVRAGGKGARRITITHKVATSLNAVDDVA